MLHGGPGTGKSRTVAAVVELASAAAQEASRSPRRPVARPSGSRSSTGARSARRCTGCSARRASERRRRSSCAARPGRSTPTSSSSTRPRCSTSSWRRRCSTPAPTAPICCSSATRRSCRRSVPAGCSATCSTPAAVPATELTTLHRQAEGGTIARLAAAVRDGELPPVDDPTREVVVVPAGVVSDEAARRVVQLVTDSIPRALGDRRRRRPGRDAGAPRRGRHASRSTRR